MDLIERQDAIKVVNNLASTMSVCASFDECKDMRSIKKRAVNALIALPSAQPEVLACGEGELSAQPEPQCNECPERQEARQTIAKYLSKEPQWIPCSERLPEESGEYLCTLVGVHNTGMPSECGYEPPNNHGITSGWSTCEADGFKFLRDDEVLAWMPLPEAWEGEEHG